jgi:hypothetical protein
MTLTAAGIDAINLIENSINISEADGSAITGQTTFDKTGGGTGTAATVSLASETQGYAIDHTETNVGGEATVTNPAPGIATEELIYLWGRSPPVMYQGYSNLPHQGTVMSDAEVAHTSCVLRAIHDHFQPLIDPDRIQQGLLDPLPEHPPAHGGAGGVQDRKQRPGPPAVPYRRIGSLPSCRTLRPCPRLGETRRVQVDRSICARE